MIRGVVCDVSKWWMLEVVAKGASEEGGFAEMSGAPAAIVLKVHRFAIKDVFHTFVVRSVLE